MTILVKNRVNENQRSVQSKLIWLNLNLALILKRFFIGKKG